MEHKDAILPLAKALHRLLTCDLTVAVRLPIIRVTEMLHQSTF
jgi:hypothetical protein